MVNQGGCSSVQSEVSVYQGGWHVERVQIDRTGVSEKVVDAVNHLVDVEVFRQRDEDVLWLLVSEEFDVVEFQLRSGLRC